MEKATGTIFQQVELALAAIGQQLVPLAFSKFGHLVAPALLASVLNMTITYHLQVENVMFTNIGHQAVPLALVTIFATRSRHLHRFQSWHPCWTHEDFPNEIFPNRSFP